MIWCFFSPLKIKVLFQVFKSVQCLYVGKQLVQPPANAYYGRTLWMRTICKMLGLLTRRLAGWLLKILVLHDGVYYKMYYNGDQHYPLELDNWAGKTLPLCILLIEVSWFRNMVYKMFPSVGSKIGWSFREFQRWGPNSRALPLPSNYHFCSTQ